MIKAEEVKMIADEINAKKKLISIAELTEWCASCEEEIIKQARAGIYSMVYDNYKTHFNLSWSEEHDIITSFFETYGYSVKFSDNTSFKICWR